MPQSVPNRSTFVLYEVKTRCPPKLILIPPRSGAHIGWQDARTAQFGASRPVGWACKAVAVLQNNSRIRAVHVPVSRKEQGQIGDGKRWHHAACQTLQLSGAGSSATMSRRKSAKAQTALASSAVSARDGVETACPR
jgi:hypothetical protein